MDIQDVFEEWDDSEVMDIEEIESMVNNKEETSESSDRESEGESTDSAVEDDNDESKLRCKKCKKEYRSKSWFLKHQNSCDGTTKATNRGINKQMSQHQLRTREVLNGLGVDDYFSNNGLPAILKLLEEICETPDDLVSVRGARYADLKRQAYELRKQLQSERTATTTVKNFLKEVTQKLWKIIFAFDHLAQTATRQRYITQQLTEFKVSQPLFARWMEVTKACGFTSDGKLFLQKIISAVYENLN